MTRRGPATTDHQARYNVGALEQRVYGLEQAIGGISQQIGALASKIDARGQTNWPVIIGFGGFALSVMVAIGGMAYWPIREAQSDLKLVLSETNKSIASLANQTAFQINQVGEKYVSIRELDQRSARSTDERKRVETDINNIEKELVPRAEHQERWRSIDTQFANIQRQLDDVKRFNADLVSVPSFLKDMNERLRSVETGRVARSP